MLSPCNIWIFLSFINLPTHSFAHRHFEDGARGGMAEMKHGRLGAPLLFVNFAPTGRTLALNCDDGDG